MRYFLTSASILFLIVAMMGWTPFEDQSSEKQKESVKASVAMDEHVSFTGKQAVGMMDCQAIHDQIRKQADYSDLFKTPAKGEKCPIVSSAAYEAVQ